ncbi:MAG TPA: hypothetical protein VLE47_02945 [Candidatus Saccharimonadales bacterium]|nr:hypothetical protein [Candidatus Saccharimonadales bacterium]
MIKLTLDTTLAKVAKVSLTSEEKTLVEVTGTSPLPAIEEALKKAGLKLAEIDQFDSLPGPGSYTGVRIGAAVANTLNFALGKKFELIEPIYQ